MGSWVDRTHSKVAAGRPSEVVDCGAGWARLQLVGEAAAGGPSKVADCGKAQARLQLADPTRWWLEVPVAPHSSTDKLDKRQGAKQTTQPRALARGNGASDL